MQCAADQLTVTLSDPPLTVSFMLDVDSAGTSAFFVDPYSPASPDCPKHADPIADATEAVAPLATDPNTAALVLQVGDLHFPGAPTLRLPVWNDTLHKHFQQQVFIASAPADIWLQVEHNIKQKCSYGKDKFFKSAVEPVPAPHERSYVVTAAAILHMKAGPIALPKSRSSTSSCVLS